MRSPIRGAFGALALASVLALSLFYSASNAVADGLSAPAMPGGWSPAPARDRQVAKAARFALAEHVRQTQNPVRLLAIKHVRQRALAGIQYSMNLLVLSEGQRRLVIAVVWARSDGSLELTRWNWI